MNNKRPQKLKQFFIFNAEFSLKLILINERLVDGSFFDNCDLNFGIALAVLKGLVF